MSRTFQLVLLLVLAGGLSAGTGARAEDCLVTQSAQAAVQRQINLIDAAKVNPSKFFTGANSCISPQLMQSFDLSNLIPDVAGFLTGAVTGTIQSVLSSAMQQVCSVANEQLSEVVSKLNAAGTCFNSTLGGQLSQALGTYSLTSMSSCTTGQYTFSTSSSSYSNLFGGSSSTQPSLGVTSSGPAGSTTSFKSIMQ